MPEHSPDPILTNALKAKGQECLGAGMGIALLSSKGSNKPSLIWKQQVLQSPIVSKAKAADLKFRH